MYIHILEFKNIPNLENNVYKFILTNDDIETCKKNHQILYDIDETLTCAVNDDIYYYIVTYLRKYKKLENYFYCYDFEELKKFIENISKCINNLKKINYPQKKNEVEDNEKKNIQNIEEKEGINLENGELLNPDLPKNKELYKILFYFRDQVPFLKITQCAIFLIQEICQKEKNPDDYNIYTNESGTLFCEEKGTRDLVFLNVDTLYNVKFLDDKIYLLQSDNEGEDKIDLNNNVADNLKVAPLKEEAFNLPNINASNWKNSRIKLDECNIDSNFCLPFMHPIKNVPSTDVRQEVNSSNGLKIGNDNEETITDKHTGAKCKVIPYDPLFNKYEEIISTKIKVYSEFPTINEKYVDEFMERRGKELKSTEPTTIKSLSSMKVSDWENQFINECEYNNEDDEEIEEDEKENIEQEFYQDENKNNILFIRDNLLEKNRIIYDRDDIKIVKNCTYLTEINIISEYIVPELEYIRNYIEKRIKNIKDKLTPDKIEKIISKINELNLLLEEEVDINKIVAVNNNKENDLNNIVQDFLNKNCIRKKGSKIYSKELYHNFYQFLIRSYPNNAIYFNKNNFTPLVKKNNFQTKRDKNGIYWIDLDFKSDFRSTYW